MGSQIDILSINTIRALCVDMVANANSGHPGAPLGLSPLFHILFTRFLNINPENPSWVNRDRLVLSNGHSSALLYAMLHLSNYKITMDDLKLFRQCNSITPGHPEAGITPGVEVTTGPLGQGVASAVGIAIAQTHTESVFNTDDIKLLTSKTFVVVGDGCLMEGISSEACSLAGHLGLSNLIVIYDSNDISIDGSTSLSFTENVKMRFKSYNFNVLECKNGDGDIGSIENNISDALKEYNRPTLIILKTTIGYGSVLQGTSSVHGSPLSDTDIKNLKIKFNLSDENFYVPNEVREFYKSILDKGIQKEIEWNSLFEIYNQNYPEKASKLTRSIAKKLPIEWESQIPNISKENISTRKSSGIILDSLQKCIPNIMGGSADLAESTCTKWNSSKSFQVGSYDGRHINFGVREHAMYAIANGISAHGLLIPYTATFLNFISYGLPAIRLSAMSKHHTIHILTHDSIGLGEDGPTHQPIEIVASLRAIPNTYVFRPADSNEVRGVYEYAVSTIGTHLICLSRQDTPMLRGSNSENCKKGAYTVYNANSEKVDAILIGTGTEVAICLEAAEALKEKGVFINVVSMTSTSLFDKQYISYRETIIIPRIPVVSVEALSTFGWTKYAHSSIGVDIFGISGKYMDVYKQLGVTKFKLVEAVEKAIMEEVYILPCLKK
eukprot:GHVP01005966.1.p1 GENE.GHVP01005966.1~~GHVP01005966.1.p1  ORF type:complete len:668 (-),score=86.09 GHVP01005966.1:12-2015(-)